jgi:Na+/H+ antiporter NhaD/arsenite permease-like protein
VAPLVAPKWWRRNGAKLSLTLGAVTALYYLFVLREPTRIAHSFYEYASFIVLIGSLFTVTGGIHIKVQGEAKPWVNCLFLFCGAILSNLLGTTGASMLLIRPWIRINRYRITGFHVVFFIAIVSNVGGCLTPIGDPPLFLGYLKGVPFWWTAQHCWPAWLLTVGILLAFFYVMDQGNFLKAPLAIRKKETQHEKWEITGLRNLIWLGLIVCAVFLQHPAGLREAVMVAAAVASYSLTPQPIRDANHFNFEPIREVAWIFAGIFATMMPALDYIQAHGSDLGIASAVTLYWLTGGLSSVLDNAPTYLTFLAAAMGRHGLSLHNPADVATFAATYETELLAISLGAVFFGAMTYIGNGPNFMVRSICEHAKVNAPGFVTYVVCFALPLFIPAFVLVWALLIAR